MRQNRKETLYAEVYVSHVSFKVSLTRFPKQHLSTYSDPLQGFLFSDNPTSFMENKSVDSSSTHTFHVPVLLYPRVQE